MERSIDVEMKLCRVSHSRATVFLHIHPAYAYNLHTPIPRTESHF